MSQQQRQQDQNEDQKTRRPANTAFKQQRLRAWQPILTPKTVLPTFFLVGVLFAPIGGVLLYQSDSVSEIMLDYTNCPDTGGQGLLAMPESAYSVSFPASISSSSLEPSQKPQWRKEGQRCFLQFSVLQDMQPPVFLYYKLTNFYQNHRRYVKSMSSEQLLGEAVPRGAILDPCKPLHERAHPITGEIKPIFPCGLIANSIFNDTINLALNGTLAANPADSTARQSDAAVQYTFIDKDISWPTDRDEYQATTYAPSEVLPPPNWEARYPGGVYTDINPPPNLAGDEHFMVWMRTAGLPAFRKLHGRNDQQILKAGTYNILVDSQFEVLKYGGTKSLVISTVSFLGGKNPFLGIIYNIVGILCVLLGCAFTITHLWRPRKLGDHTYLSWNQQTGATATGGVGDGILE